MTVTQSVEKFLDLTLDDDDDDCSDGDDCDDDDVVIVQDLRIMQQALKESEDRYQELAVRVPLVRSPPATPEKSRLNSVGGHAAAASSSSFSFQPPASTGLGHENDEEDGSLDELFRLRAKVINLEAEVERLTEVLEAGGKAELARCDSMPHASKCECTYRSKRHILMGEWVETCLFFHFS